MLCARRPALRRPQHRFAAFRRSAAAGEDRVYVGRIVIFTLDLVIISQLLARLDGTDRLDVDASSLDDGLAIRIARVVEKTRLVAHDAGIDHRSGIDDEQERVIVVRLLGFVAAVRFLVRHTFADILDEARALGYASGREDALAMHLRAAHLDQILPLGASLRHRQMATGALIAA